MDLSLLLLKILAFFSSSSLFFIASIWNGAVFTLIRNAPFFLPVKICPHASCWLKHASHMGRTGPRISANITVRELHLWAHLAHTPAPTPHYPLSHITCSRLQLEPSRDKSGIHKLTTRTELLQELEADRSRTRFNWARPGGGQEESLNLLVEKVHLVGCSEQGSHISLLLWWDLWAKYSLHPFTMANPCSGCISCAMPPLVPPGPALPGDATSAIVSSTKYTLWKSHTSWILFLCTLFIFDNSYPRHSCALLIQLTRQPKQSASLSSPGTIQQGSRSQCYSITGSLPLWL